MAVAARLFPGNRCVAVALYAPRWRERTHEISAPGVVYGILLPAGGLGAAVTLGGCGNSFYTREAPPAPVTQTYTVTIAASSGPLNHSTTVTLVVN